MIRLHQLRLTNFRCYSEAFVEFHPELTVLVAQNGQGKTALLDAIAIAFGLFVEALSDLRQKRTLEWSDIRWVLNQAENRMIRAAGKVSFEAVATVNATPVEWSRERLSDSPRRRTTRRSAWPIIEIAEQLRSKLRASTLPDSTPVDLPLVIYYGTARRWNDHDGSSVEREAERQRLVGYDSCLSSASHFGMFANWYGATFESIENAPTTGVQSQVRPEQLLAAVNAAVDAVLKDETGWHGLHWNQDLGLLLVHSQYGTLPLRFLSDGVRSMVALVGDLAHRCARLNPHLGADAAASTQGIVLIDEIDLHLHPDWQQRIIELLKQTFPKLQFVVSTHSPQVLSTVFVDQIRVIRLVEGTIEIGQPSFQTRGVESADVLATIMGVDPVPKVLEATQLSAYRAMVERGEHESSEGRQLRLELLSHFGSLHPVMADCDRLIRFTQFKRGRATERPDAQA